MSVASWVKRKIWKTVVRSRVKDLMGSEGYKALHEDELQPAFVDAIYNAAWKHYGAEAVAEYVSKTGRPYVRATSELFMQAATRFIFVFMNSVAVDRDKGVQFTPSVIDDYERDTVNTIKKSLGV